MNNIVTEKKKRGQRGAGRTAITKTCALCGKVFFAKLNIAKYCSAYCRDKYYRINNPQGASKRTRKSYAKHREKRIEAGRLWKKAHPDYNQKRYRENPELRLWYYKDRSRKRNIDWSLSDEQALLLFTSTCYYCGEDGLGIDRIDNKLGYIPENCVSCCKECNTMKMDSTLEVFLNKVSKIAARWARNR